MPYCPVLFEIVDPLIKEKLQCRFILEIYDQKGRAVFQRKLNCKQRNLNLPINQKYSILKYR
jgi:hypothetical protein